METRLRILKKKLKKIEGSLRFSFRSVMSTTYLQNEKLDILREKEREKEVETEKQRRAIRDNQEF